MSQQFLLLSAHQHRSPIENKFRLAANLVDINDRKFIFKRHSAPGYIASNLPLIVIEKVKPADVYNYIQDSALPIHPSGSWCRVGHRKIFHRSSQIVMAKRNPRYSANIIRQSVRSKIPVFIEHIVIRKQPFMRFCKNFSLGQDQEVL